MQFIAVIDHNTGKRIWINARRVAMVGEAKAEDSLQCITTCTAIHFIDGTNMLARGSAEVFVKKLKGIVCDAALTL